MMTRWSLTLIALLSTSALVLGAHAAIPSCDTSSCLDTPFDENGGSVSCGGTCAYNAVDDEILCQAGRFDTTDDNYVVGFSDGSDSIVFGYAGSTAFCCDFNVGSVPIRIYLPDNEGYGDATVYLQSGSGYDSCSDETWSESAKVQVMGSDTVYIQGSDFDGTGSYTWHDELFVYEGSPITIYGGDGDDQLEYRSGGSNGVTFYGDGGADTLLAGDGADSLYGGSGADVLRARGGIDLLEGGAGDDTLWAGGEGDSVKGQGGDDVLRGEDGADTIWGGDNADTIDAGDGDDVVYGDDAGGTQGDDYILGGGDDDLIFGYSGSDTISGGSGADTIWGDSGLTGGDDDFLYGGEGNDELHGEGGDDLVCGQDGTDDVRGDAGLDDTCAETGETHVSCETVEDTCPE